MAKIRAEIKKLDKLIKEETKKLSLRKGSANMEITVVITADNDTRADLKLSYSECFASRFWSNLIFVRSRERNQLVADV